MKNINYVVGDATRPQGEGNKIICHICNDKKRWGAGFVLAISNRWSAPVAYYRFHQDMTLGTMSLVKVENDIWVANMIGQHDTQYDENGNPPVRYDAVRAALSKVNAEAIEINATIHAPMFGAGLSGGKWEEIEKIIKEVVTVDVTIYDLK